jgi:hypothetical protein
MKLLEIIFTLQSLERESRLLSLPSFSFSLPLPFSVLSQLMRRDMRAADFDAVETESNPDRSSAHASFMQLSPEASSAEQWRERRKCRASRA